MKTIFAAALFAASLGGLGAASAMPLAPLAAADTAAVIQVAQGCGPGFARGPGGGCLPMAVRRGPVIVERPVVVRRPIVVERPVVVRPGRICPPGFAFRFGRCRPF